MNIAQIIRRLFPFARLYKKPIAFSLLLTILGAVAAQVNPLVLRYAVDSVGRLLKDRASAHEKTMLLVFISSILFVKELCNIVIKYGQSMVGEYLRTNLSGFLAQHAVERILRYGYAFYVSEDNATGKLQTRIDRGVESLTGFVQNVFIDLLPLFANAAMALVLMFAADFYVGITAFIIMPVYFLLSWRQAFMLRGVRRGLRMLRERKANGLFNIIESIIVIKSFVREEYEREKQYAL
jgi:ABC-type multidrug transport system fused ATPase/permease subunit